MKNTYEIRGDVVAIRLTDAKRNGAEALIDLVDLPLISSIRGTWSAMYNQYTTYACFSTGAQGCRRCFYMHKLIAKTPDGYVTDHIDHNGLNNRRANLRVVSRSINGANRSGPAAHNRSSGFRGVHLHKRSGLYNAKFRRKSFGYYETPEEAARVIQGIAESFIEAEVVKQQPKLGEIMSTFEVVPVPVEAPRKTTSRAIEWRALVEANGKALKFTALEPREFDRMYITIAQQARRENRKLHRRTLPEGMYLWLDEVPA